jgi:hypothetical protein
MIGSRRGPLHHRAVQGLHRGLHVGDVSTRDHGREGSASLVDEDVPLRA